MPSANCFDAPTLKDYLLGRLSDEQSEVVAAHLEACLSCEATVSQLDRASDTLTNGLRLPAVAAEPPHFPFLNLERKISDPPWVESLFEA